MTLKLAKPTGAAIKIAKPTGAKLSITPNNLLVDDADALAYLTAVETADGQALESGVRLAVNAFVKGCKADGIWPALKASCILAGARTRLGALTPLVGAAPTSFNFVDADYNRKTGLVGNGSTKYLNSNRAGNADPRNNIHQCLYTDSPSSGIFIGAGDVATTGSSYFTHSGTILSVRSQSSGTSSSSTIFNSGFIGVSRSTSSDFNYRHTNNISGTVLQSSTTPTSRNHFVYARNGSPAGYVTSRFAFYSIGTSLDLALLDARVTTLINAIGAAIP